MRRLGYAAALAVGVTALAIAFRATPGASIPLVRLDAVLYDSLYNLRPIEDQSDGPVVIVIVDDPSIEKVDQGKVFGSGFGWPWPRSGWGSIAKYVGQCGAKAVAIDILFKERSAYEYELTDDDAFAELVEASTAPVIFGVQIPPDGSPPLFGVPIKDPHLGAVDVNEPGTKNKMFRDFAPQVREKPSLALETVLAAGYSARLPEKPFLLHYYGPSERPGGKRTFKYIPAANVLHTALKPQYAAADGIDPSMFKGKIVLIGCSAIGTYDLKSTPLSDAISGSEIQATAMVNLLQGQEVVPVSPTAAAGLTLLISFLAAIGVMLPRGVQSKLFGATGALALLLTIAILLFVKRDIVYLPLAAPISAGFLATIGGFAWSYLSEDRRRKILLKALSRVVSPVIADELSRDPDKLVLGGQRREMTVMFTDIAGFTDMSETLQAEKLAPLLNFYLGEMSTMVFSANGTLDKYIGDAIMSFWNAPLQQPDHAALACRAALSMAQKERDIQPRLVELGAVKVYTRMGINSGPMAVGFTGSSHLFNYTVLGDSVNLGSRLEGANKMYGTQIMLSHSTAEQVKGQFLFRKLDLLRVKGKKLPMGVYELMAEGSGTESQRRRAQRYEEAFALYQQQQWDAAEQILLEIIAEFLEDAPSAALLARITKYRHDPPGPTWDGVYIAKEK